MAETRLDAPKKPYCMNEEDKALVWIHGYNVNAKAAIATYAEVFKRLFHAGLNAKFYGISWYCDPPAPLSFTTVAPPHYHEAVVNAFNMAGKFNEFITGVVKKENSQVSIVGHSLGNMVIGVAIQDSNPHLDVDNYIAVDAAVALEAYGSDYDVDHSMLKVTNSGRNWKSYFDHDSNNNSNQKKLLPSEWHTLFEATDHRNKLTWRNRLKNVIGDNIYNFYSSTEDVLATYDGDNMVWDESLLNFPDKAWAKQEKFKGRINDVSANIGGVASPYAGWGFNVEEPDLKC